MDDPSQPPVMPRLALACLAALAALWAAPAPAQTAPPGSDLRVAVAPAPPFVEAGADSTWDGLGVHLAREVAVRLGRGVRFVPVSDPVAAVAGGAADVAVAPASVDAETRADVAAPFYTDRLAVARSSGSGVAEVAGRFFSATFFKIALGLSVLLLLIGLAMWAVERHAEGDDFREDKAGIWDGFWWAGVTMTTIGYGDTVPSTTGGRVIALLWMLVSLAVTSALTAALVSALGVGGSGGDSVAIPGDLRGDRVGVVEGSVAAAVLAESRVTAEAVPTVEAGLDAVADGTLDALVGSAPRLRAATSDRDLSVETTDLEADRWALVVAEGGDLREPVARAVLERVQSPDWASAVARYLPSGD